MAAPLRSIFECCALSFLIWAPTVLVAANFDFNGGQPKFCKPYTCGKGLTPVQKWPLSFESSGCSSLGGGMIATSGATDGSNDIHERCCDQRAACLQTCGSVKTACDEELKKCVEKNCSEKGDDEEKCNQRASIFSIMVSLENCQPYSAVQHSHCECVPAEDAPAKREDLLHKFYETFSPDSVGKAKDLSKKADTTRKMANLMGKLVQKYYPDTIQKVKDPNAERMEQLMRESQKATNTVVEEEDVEADEDDAEEEEVQEL
ncbi:unnamed protein product [Pseudo-nitzschia multistriata]|uniref:Phospholipase A2 domain-containing protein n=1 Tax=Pseudo-nitzschia multistriata TaxID=183589 RepID=A0A448YWY2_9STRA|nr:unnamed protein product [Pseudo-nitzschia multistriata]